MIFDVTAGHEQTGAVEAGVAFGACLKLTCLSKVTLCCLLQYYVAVENILLVILGLRAGCILVRIPVGHRANMWNQASCNCSRAADVVYQQTNAKVATAALAQLFAVTFGFLCARTRMCVLVAS